MNKLLAISVALLSVSLYGADKLKHSPTGLEGIGKEGIRIHMGGFNSSKGERGVSKVIENQIELRLRQVGIKVDTKELSLIPWLSIHALHIGDKTQEDYVFLKASRAITYEANGIKYIKRAIVWEGGAISKKDGLRETIHELMDKFLLDYLKANPIKEK